MCSTNTNDGEKFIQNDNKKAGVTVWAGEQCGDVGIDIATCAEKDLRIMRHRNFRNGTTWWESWSKADRRMLQGWEQNEKQDKAMNRLEHRSVGYSGKCNRERVEEDIKTSYQKVCE
jgi:hypothetical protein